MSSLIDPLPWDTEFFERSIGRATISQLDAPLASELLAEARARRIDCFYFNAIADDALTIEQAEIHGFHMVDLRTVLSRPVPDSAVLAGLAAAGRAIVVEPPRPDDAPRLREIATEISKVSRFAFDRGFPPGASDRLYQLWMERACQDYADAAMVARRSADGEATGFLSCTRVPGSTDSGAIQLAGVHPAQRGLGVGAALVATAVGWAAGEKLGSIEVATQARNVGALRLYQRAGFLTRSVTLVYHKWMRP